jgi:hypothetical protein
MHKLLKKLFSFWLAVALCISPLQALTANAAADKAAPCEMRLKGASEHHPAAMQPAGHHTHHHQLAASAGSDCPRCQQDNCSGGDCSPSTCTTVHLHPGVIASLLLAEPSGSDSNVTLPATIRDSRSDPPPLRPPL